MEHIRILMGSLEFNELNYRRTLAISSEHQEHLEDVEMVIHGSPTLNGDGVGRLSIHLNEHDITGAVISCLQAKIMMRDQVEVKEEYEEAVRNVVSLKQRNDNPNRSPDEPPDLGKDLDIADKYLEGELLWQKLEALGDYDEAWYGSFHIFNFLYSHILLDPISLVDVLNVFGQGTPGLPALNLRQLKPLKFTFTAGSAPGAIPRGVVTCRLEARYHNLLDDEVQALKERVSILENRVRLVETEVATLNQQIKTLGTKILQSLTGVRKELSPVGKIQRTQQETTIKLNKLVEDIEKHESHVVNQERELTSLNARAVELRQIIDTLR